MRSSSKEFFTLMDAFRVFVVQQGEATTQNQKITKLMNHIAKKLGAISPKCEFYQGDHRKEGDQNKASAAMVAPSGGVHGNPMLRN